MKAFRFAGTALGLSAALVLLGSPAPAQEVARGTQIKLQLEQIATGYKQMDEMFGVSETVQTIIQRQPKATPMVLKLEAGSKATISVTAFCNPDCPTVRIEGTSPSGNALDPEEDHPAVMQVGADGDGQYTLSIQFPGCKSDACDVGILVTKRTKS